MFVFFDGVCVCLSLVFFILCFLNRESAYVELWHKRTFPVGRQGVGSLGSIMSFGYACYLRRSFFVFQNKSPSPPSIYTIKCGGVISSTCIGTIVSLWDQLECTCVWYNICIGTVRISRVQLFSPSPPILIFVCVCCVY